ncbi:MAG: hypothetical protein WDW38_007097 [Sanguina aurantia]
MEDGMEVPVVVEAASIAVRQRLERLESDLEVALAASLFVQAELDLSQQQAEFAQEQLRASQAGAAALKGPTEESTGAVSVAETPAPALDTHEAGIRRQVEVARGLLSALQAGVTQAQKGPQDAQQGRTCVLSSAATPAPSHPAPAAACGEEGLSEEEGSFYSPAQSLATSRSISRRGSQDGASAQGGTLTSTLIPASSELAKHAGLVSNSLAAVPSATDPALHRRLHDAHARLSSEVQQVTCTWQAGMLGLAQQLELQTAAVEAHCVSLQAMPEALALQHAGSAVCAHTTASSEAHAERQRLQAETLASLQQQLSSSEAAHAAEQAHARAQASDLLASRSEAAQAQSALAILERRWGTDCRDAAAELAEQVAAAGAARQQAGLAAAALQAELDREVQLTATLGASGEDARSEVLGLKLALAKAGTELEEALAETRGARAAAEACTQQRVDALAREVADVTQQRLAVLGQLAAAHAECSALQSQVGQAVDDVASARTERTEAAAELARILDRLATSEAQLGAALAEQQTAMAHAVAAAAAHHATAASLEHALAAIALADSDLEAAASASAGLLHQSDLHQQSAGVAAAELATAVAAHERAASAQHRAEERETHALRGAAAAVTALGLAQAALEATSLDLQAAHTAHQVQAHTQAAVEAELATVGAELAAMTAAAVLSRETPCAACGQSAAEGRRTSQELLACCTAAAGLMEGMQRAVADATAGSDATVAFLLEECTVLQRSLSVASQEAGDSKASACAAMRVMHTRMLDVRRELSSAHSDSLQQQRQDDARAWGQERASERELHSVKAGEELVAHSAAVSVLQCHISDLQAQLAASVSQAQGAEAQTVAATSEHVQQMLALGGLSKHQLDAAMSGLHCQLQRQRQITGGMAAAADAATHLAGVMDAEMKMRLEGNTDERGTREYNLGLGERRGKTVSDAMTAAGGSASQINVISNGKEKPVCREHNEDCWSKNRRVEIVYTAE